jgi:hypothetical protein
MDLGQVALAGNIAMTVASRLSANKPPGVP